MYKGKNVGYFYRLWEVLVNNLNRDWEISILPVELSLLDNGSTVSPRDRDFSMRTCRSSCGLEFGSCRPFSRGFDDGVVPVVVAFVFVVVAVVVVAAAPAALVEALGFFSLFGWDGIIVILLCFRVVVPCCCCCCCWRPPVSVVCGTVCSVGFETLYKTY